MPEANISPPRPRRLPPARRLVAAGLVLASVSWVAGGCGSSHSTGTSADPATVVPAAAALYAGAFVRPGGALKSHALAAGRALIHQANPYAAIAELLRIPGQPAIDYGRDVAPWLGPQAAVFADPLTTGGRSSATGLLSSLLGGLLGGSRAALTLPFAARGPHGAIVMDTSDVARARSFLNAEASRTGAHGALYRGVSYELSGSGVAFGIIDRFAVIGSESGLRGVIDTTLGGASLARAPDYSRLLAVAPSGALAHVYANPAAATAARDGLEGLLGGLTGRRALNASLVPSGSSAGVDVDALAPAPAGSGGLLSSVSRGEQALGELPGESWLGLGLTDTGTALGQDAQGLRSLPSLLGSSSAQSSASAAISVNGLLEAFLTPLLVLGAEGAQARHDFQSWMGSAGIFAAGNGLLELKGGVVIASKDPALSRAAVGKLAAALARAGGTVTPVSVPNTNAAVAVKLPKLPLALYIAEGPSAGGQDKFVLGLGEASVQAALNPSSTLSGTPSHAAAAQALGEGIQPSLILDVPTLVGLLEGTGLSEDPTISKLLPALRSMTSLAGGGKSLGAGIERFRLVLGLRASG